MLLKTLLPLSLLASALASPLIDRSGDLVGRELSQEAQDALKPPSTEEVQAAEAAAVRAGGGFNSWACKAGDGRLPIIFLHGLSAPTLVNWFYIAPSFAARGYCVYTPQYGTKDGILFGFDSMRESAKWLSGYVQKVKQSTGAAKVHLVGHSMGTTVSTYYMKFEDGASEVDHFVGFGSNYNGTSFFGLNNLVRSIPLVDAIVLEVCPSCQEFLSPSPFMADLQRDGVTVEGPDYTTIVSKYDQMVTPYTSGLIREEGVENIVLQDRCWFDYTGHLFQAIDPNVKALIRWAIEDKQAGRRKPLCAPFGFPLIHIRDVEAKPEAKAQTKAQQLDDGQKQAVEAALHADPPYVL